MAEEGSAAGAADSGWLLDMVIQLMNSTNWKEPLRQYITDNCVKFDNFQEENKHEYMEVHADFKNLVDSLLTAHLLEVDIDPEDFEKKVMESGLTDDPRFREELNNLVAAEDFVVFKDMMLAHHHALQQKAEVGFEHAAVQEEHARKAVEAAELAEVEAVAAAADAADAQRAAAAAAGGAEAAAATGGAPSSPKPASPSNPTAKEERAFTAAGGTYGRAVISPGKKPASNDKAAAIRKAILAGTSRKVGP